MIKPTRHRHVGHVSAAGLVLSTVLPMLAAFAVPDPAQAGQEAVIDGVVHVANSDEPSEGVQTFRLEELWSVGGEDSEDTIFGVIGQIFEDDGNIYLLDTQLSEIKVFTHDGQALDVLGREGDGPGEFRGPADMCLLPDGTIGVLQGFPGKVIKLALDGTPAGVWNLGDPSQGSFYFMSALNQGNGTVVAGGVQQTIDQGAGTMHRERFLSSIGQDGLRDVTYVSVPVIQQLNDLRVDELEIIDGPDRRFDITTTGLTVVGIPRNEYEVSIFAADGTLERVFTREYASWPRNERAAGIWQRVMENIRDNIVPGAPASWEDTEPDIEFLQTAADGSIWILNSRSMWEPPEGVFTCYDVFTPDGHYQKEVRVVCPGDPTVDLLFYSGGDRAFMVTDFWDAALGQFGGDGSDEGDEDIEPMKVICYRVG